jgi:hypothetical protein
MSAMKRVFMTKQLPADVYECGFYEYLFPDSQDLGSEFSSPLADGNWEHSAADLWSICPLPPSPPYLSVAIDSIRRWFDILVHFYEIDGNTLGKRRVSHVHRLLNDIETFAHLSEPVVQFESNEVALPARRTQLRDYLTQFPLYSTLLLIESVDDEQKQFWLWLLVRLREANGEISYEACLQFDRLRERYQERVLPCSVLYLQECTLSELRSRLIEHDVFCVLVPYLKSAVKKRKQISFPYRSDNEHKTKLTLEDGEEVTITTPTDLEGNEQLSYIEREIVQHQPELTHKRAKRHFQLKKAGMARAIHRANLRLPMSNEALTPAELSAWIQFHCPELLAGNFVGIDTEERPHWCVLFLSMLGITDFDLICLNHSARGQVNIKPPCLVYELDRSEHCTSYLVLPTDIFKGRTPDKPGTHYYSAQASVEVILPWPIQSLLNYILRSRLSNQRHNKPLKEVLNVTPHAHQQWLRDKIASSKMQFAFNVTPASISRAFFHFSYQQFPTIFADYLNTRGSVQAHYVNVESSELSATLHDHWRDFLMAMNFTSALGWDSETSFVHSPVATFHGQIGSEITLREEVLVKALDALLSPLDDDSRAIPSDCQQQVKAIERIVLYLHIRSAIELALRPVNEPYPDAPFCACENGVWTVADKRSHHKDERRLLVLSPALAQLLTQYQRWASAMSSTYYLENRAALMLFDGKQWLPLNRKQVQQLLNQYLDGIDVGCFRHLSAHLIIDEALLTGNDFDQTEINVRMNHFQRGQNPLISYSLLSVSELVKQQQAMQRRQHEGKAGDAIAFLCSEFLRCDEILSSFLIRWEKSGVRVNG